MTSRPKLPPFVLIVAAPLAAGSAGAAPVKPPESVAHYRVVTGDTLYQLAQTYCRRVEDYREIQALNGVAAPRRLPVGRDLAIPVRLLRTEPSVAYVETFSGQATRTAGGAAATVARGLPVREGDRLETGANSFMRLSLPDGSHVTLPSFSRFVVQTLRRTVLTGTVDRSFLLEAGRSESVVTPMTRPEDRYIVRTPLSIAAVRGTDFKVSFDPQAARSAVEVVQGKVDVSTAAGGGSEALVPRAQGVVVASGVVGQPVDLLAAPILKVSDHVQDGADVVFAVEALPGARRYRAVIAPDAGLLDPLSETESDGPELDVGPLGDGEWFVQLTAIAADGLEGLPQTYGFERVRNGARLEQPTQLGERGVRRWLFRWRPEGFGDHRYRFQLKRVADPATPVIDEAALIDGQIVVTDLEPGAYTWRVRTTLIRNGRSYETWSALRQFRIDR